MANTNSGSDRATDDRYVNRRRLLKTGSGIALGGLLAGCSGGSKKQSNPSGGSDGGSDGDSGGDTSTSTPTASLQERAKQEGMVKEATSITGVKKFYKQFEKDTGVTHERFRSDATKVATRILQELKAGQLSFDYHRAGDPTGGLSLYKQGAYEDVPASIQEKWPNRVRFNDKFMADWFGLKLSLLYNKNKVSNPPTSIEELASEYKGQYTVDVRDEFIWVALRDRLGESKAKELVSKLGDGAVWKESHYTAAKNVASGEVPMGLTYNKFKYYDFGDVLAEQDLKELPRVVRQITSSILKDPKHPAAAELYMKYTHENIIDFLNSTGRPDAYFNPDDVIGNDDFYIWGLERLSNIDLKQADSEWKEHTGLSG